MVHFLHTKPALDDARIKRELAFVATGDIFGNLTSGELEKAFQWYDALRREEQLNLNGVLRTVIGVRLREKFSGLDENHALLVAGSSIDSRSYSDIDLFILPRQYSTHTLTPTGMDQSAIRSPFDNNSYNYCNLREALVQFNCFFGDIERGYGEYGGEHERPAAFIGRQDLGKEITLYLLQAGRITNDFRKRRSGSNDDFVYVATNAESIIGFNRENGSKFLVLSRSYKPGDDETVPVIECFKRNECVLYQPGILAQEVRAYMCDGVGRDTPEKTTSKGGPECPVCSAK
jgi:hypothetical protein